MRHSTADSRVPNPTDLAAVCLRSSTARKGPTRGVPPLPTVPIPAGSIRHAGGCLQPVLAHMLGFRGHFSTKSRTYSNTLGASASTGPLTSASAP
jgi:hypothetical protein